MERGLGNEAVGEGNSEEAGDTGCKAYEEDVPVKAGWLAKGEFASLGDQR